MKKSLYISSIALASLLNAQQVQSIKYVNLSMISQNVADESLGFEIGDEISSKQMNKAVKEFYKFGYFNDVIVKSNEGNVEFTFVEKPIVANIEMTGYKTRDTDLREMYKKIGLSKGTMYSSSKLKHAKKALLKELEAEGYVYSVVEVEVEQLNENAVSILFDVNKGDEIVIKNVNYYGLNNLDVSDLENVTANKEEEAFSWFFGRNDGEAKVDELPYDSRRIQDEYFKNGYLDSKVKDPFMKVNFANNSGNLDFFISEGIQYSTSSIKIYVNKEIIDENTLYPDLKLKVGRVFNISKLRRDSKFIKTAVADLGYAFTEVKYDIKKNTEEGTAEIVFNVIPGEKVYINDVFISGNIRTLDRVIRRDVYLAPGDLFNLTDFKDSKNRLQRNGFFDNVSIEQKRVSATQMDLIVKVEETSTGNIIIGGGFGSYDGLILNAEINEKNVFGSGKTVGFSVERSDRKLNLAISYKDPAINDGSYTGTAEIHKTDSEIDYSDPDYTLDKKTSGFSVGIGKEWIRNLYAGVTYKFDVIEEEYTDDNADDDYEVSDYKTDEDYISSSIIPYLSFNNTDDYYFPRSGMKAKVSLQYAGIGGEAKYSKIDSTFKYFYSLDDALDLDWVLRYRAKVGVLIDNGKITQGDSYYLGGTSTVRGYSSYAFGPDASSSDPAMKRVFSNSIELSLPLIPSSKMRWGVFYDYGMIGQDSFNDINRSGAGALVEWISPFGPMQFIFAEALDAEDGDDTASFEFSLGSQF